MIWILGIQAHKEAPKIIRNLLKPSDIAWLVPIPNHQSWTSFQLSETCPELSEQLKSADKVEEVLQKLHLEKKWPEPPPVIAGSIYLVGDLLTKNIIR